MARCLSLIDHMDKILEQVKEFADKAHGDQKRKYTSERYIVHPERVTKLCQQYTSSIPVLAAALLHDVLEDTRVTKTDLHNFLLFVISKEDAKQTTQLVVELTDIYTKSKYPRLNRKRRKQKEANRIEKTSPDAQTVKYSDIIDNCKEIVVHDPEFAHVFLMECKMLLKIIPNGNAELYHKATETVDHCLKQVPTEYRTSR
jgi:guanosine-3',5'-bis(diphosphate) 3'-pyrophosphohydrolase